LQRPQFFYTSVGIFFHSALSPLPVFPVKQSTDRHIDHRLTAAAVSPAADSSCLDLPRPALARSPSHARDPHAWGEMSALQLTAEDDGEQLVLALSRSSVDETPAESSSSPQ
jgi:hypothetical protein